MLLIAISAPRHLMQPTRAKISTSKRRDLSAKSGYPAQGLQRNASLAVVPYCAVVLPLVIVSSICLVLEPLASLVTSHRGGGVSPNLSEIVGYSAWLCGVSALSTINHVLPTSGMEAWRRVSALVFVAGLFVSFSAPAFPGAF